MHMLRPWQKIVKEHSIWELLGKILAVVGVIALILLVIFSERAEKQETPKETPGVTATLAPTETPVPTEAPTPTEPPEEDGTIVLPFVPAT